MPGQVIGTIGQEDVRLENAATESTMLLLLQALERLEKKTGKKTGSADKAQELHNKALNEGTEAKEKENKKVRDLNKELDSSKKKFKDVTSDLDGIMRTLSAGIGKVFGDATPSVEGFTKAFEGVPVVGGVISTLGGVLGQNIKTFRTLNAVGIDLGNGIYGAQVAAANAGLPLEVFAKTVAENSQALQTFGGTATAGAQAFSNVIGGFKKSGAMAAMGRLGMSMDEISNNTVTYMEIQARTGRAAMMTQAELQQGALEYNLELDKMSRATGLNRKQIDDANKAMARDAKLRVAMARMSEKDQIGWNARIKQLQEAGLHDQAEGLKDLLASGGVAVTRNSAMLVATNQEFSEAARQGFLGIEGSSQFLTDTIRNTGKAAQDMSNDERQMSGTLSALGKNLPQTIAAQFGGLNMSTEALEQAARDQAKAINDPAKNAANLDQALTDVQNTLKMALLPILEGFANIVATKVVPALNSLVDWISEHSIGEILLAAFTAGIALMFAKVAASKVLETAIEKLMGGASTGGKKAPDVDVDTTQSKQDKGAPKGKGKPGLGGRLLKGIKGFGVGTVVGVGAGLAADALGKDSKAGAAADILGKTASYAGTGAMLGSFFPGPGTAIGGAVGGVVGAGMGLWENRKTLFGGDSKAKAVPEVKVNPKLAEDWAWSIITGKATFDQVPKGYEDAVMKLLTNPPKHWLEAPAVKKTDKAPATPNATPAKGAESSAGSKAPKTPELGVAPEAVQVAQTNTANEIKELAAALKEVDYNKLIFPSEVTTSMTAGTTQAKLLKDEVLNLAASFKELNNTGLSKITEGIARLDESFKSFNKSFVEDFITKFKELDKKSQETLLTEISAKMDSLNTSMVSLIDIQQDAAKGIGKTAKYTKQSTGNMIG